MDSFDQHALPPLYTGRSAFLSANRHMVQAMVQAAGRCRIQSSEDIYDARGIKLWARDRPLEPALLTRLADRPLRKPIELCVTALDPVTTLSMLDSLRQLALQSGDFARLLALPRLAFDERLLALSWNPQERLLLSLLRFGTRDRLTHALGVAVLALEAARVLLVPERQQAELLRAALLHDLGLLYLPPPTDERDAEDAHPSHATLGALAARELAGCGAATTQLIATSHERLNGQGYPMGLGGASLSPSQRALSFAEAMIDHLCDPRRGAMRVAVASRLLPGEFDPLLSGQALKLARARALLPEPLTTEPSTVPVGLALRHLHVQLSRVIVTLSLLYADHAVVVERGRAWLLRLQPLMHALRSSGIEDALALGREIQPASVIEAAELSAMQSEIVSRVQSLARSVEGETRADGVLAASRPVAEVVRLLNSACDGPGPASAAVS